MTTFRIWLIAAAVCVAWAYAPDGPAEYEAAQATQDVIDDTAAKLMAAREPQP